MTRVLVAPPGCETWTRIAPVTVETAGIAPFNMGGADEYVLADALLAVARNHTPIACEFLSAEP